MMIEDRFPGCNKCKEGYRQYTGPFYYWDQLSNGKACPKDGSNLVDCQALALPFMTTEYICKECPPEKPTKLSFKEGPISAMCIAQPSEPLPSCQSYKKYEEDFTKLECATCVFGSQLIEHVQIGLNTYASLCASVLFVFPGCTQYVKTEDGVMCKSCDSHHDFLPFDSTKYPPPDYDTSIILGQCVLKSRFDLDLTQKCQHYTFLTKQWLFVCEKCQAQGEVSPCAQPKGVCRNGLAQVKISKSGVISSKCVNLRIDFCEIYQQQVSTTSCLKCRDGYELVFMSQHRISPFFNKICIKKSYVIPGCYIYHSFQLNCLIYRNPACIVPEFPPQLYICSKTVLVGYTHVCISCPVGYTLKNNSCLKSVQYCANLSSSGYCISCVQPQKYQLINNTKCVQRPKFCKSVKFDGSCELCQDGYSLNKIGNCTISSKKDCPSYYYLNSQNECVPGAISNCLIYQTYGESCLQCKPNYILSSDFKECKPINKWIDLPPCPSDNKEFRYERNDKGECIPIDTKCLNYIKQNGYCYQCSENSYAYQGLCYNIEFSGQGN